MSKETIKRKTVCANCNREIKLTQEILQSGCPFCGSFKFRTMRVLSEEEKKIEEIDILIEKEMEIDDITKDISSIRLKKDGTFEVDLEKLINEISDETPIITRDKDGSYHVKFQK